MLKGLRQGKISKVFIASNCGEDIKSTLEHYTNISKGTLVSLKYPNDELGMICRKTFSISVLGVVR